MKRNDDRAGLKTAIVERTFLTKQVEIWGHFKFAAFQTQTASDSFFFNVSMIRYPDLKKIYNLILYYAYIVLVVNPVDSFS